MGEDTLKKSKKRGGHLKKKQKKGRTLEKKTQKGADTSHPRAHGTNPMLSKLDLLDLAWARSKIAQDFTN